MDNNYRDISLLSFADEANEEEKELEQTGETHTVLSSHDLLKPRSVAGSAREGDRESDPGRSVELPEDRSDEGEVDTSDRLPPKRKIDEISKGEENEADEEEDIKVIGHTNVDAKGVTEGKKTKKKKNRKEIANLAREYLSAQRQKYKKRATGKEREQEALMKVFRFTESLGNGSGGNNDNGGGGERKRDVNDEEGGGDEDDDMGWKAHCLAFDTSRHRREQQKAEQDFATYDSLTHTSTSESSRSRDKDRRHREPRDRQARDRQREHNPDKHHHRHSRSSSSSSRSRRRSDWR